MLRTFISSMKTIGSEGTIRNDMRRLRFIYGIKGVVKVISSKRFARELYYCPPEENLRVIKFLPQLEMLWTVIVMHFISILKY